MTKANKMEPWAPTPEQRAEHAACSPATQFMALDSLRSYLQANSAFWLAHKSNAQGLLAEYGPYDVRRASPAADRSRSTTDSCNR